MNPLNPVNRLNRRAFRIVAALAALVVLAAVGRSAGALLPRFAAWIDGLGPWGPALYVLGYTVATVAMVPGSILTLTAGALFGLAKGTIVAFLGAVCGAAAAFLVSRYVARGFVERSIMANLRFAAIDRAIGAEGGKIVLLLRLSPVVPYNLLNYALGITRVSFTAYIVASVGMIPAEMVYVYYGKVAGDVIALSAGATIPKGPAYYVVTVLGLVATVVVTTILARIATRALRQSTEEVVSQADVRR